MCSIQEVLIPEIDCFFSAIRDDSRINPVHISLFMAIIQVWSANNWQNPICIFSKELMHLAKISGIATYYRSIKELHDYGHIIYKPSHSSNPRSLIYVTSMKVIMYEE